MANKPGNKAVQITETVLRDAHQSLIATRMTTEEMLPIVEDVYKRQAQFLLYSNKADPLLC